MAFIDSLLNVTAIPDEGDPAVDVLRDVHSVAYVEILDIKHALSILASDWSALECEAGKATFFQGVGWTTALQRWAHDRAEMCETQSHQVIITRDREGQLTGLWPIQAERIFGVEFAVALGEPFSQYSDILVAPHVDRGIVVDAMLASVRSLGRFAGVLLRKVRDDAVCVRPLRSLGHEIGAAAAPAVDLRPFESFECYHRSVKSKTRKNLRNARNRLERFGEKLTHIVHTDAGAVAEVAQRAFHLRTIWLEQEGLSSRAFLDDGFEMFIDTVCRVGQQPDGLSLVAFELRLGDEMLSLQWGFISGGRYYAFMAVRNPAFDAQSPGRLHLEYVIRSCANMNIDMVDFLAPDVSYKQTWATNTVAVRDYGIAFTFAGQMVLRGVLGTPRRLARQMFDGLPCGVRQLTIRVLARKFD